MNSPEPIQSYVPSREDLTWRDGHETLVSAHLGAINERLSLLKDALAASILSTDNKAQTANNELERLLEANMTAIATLANQRFESTNVAIIKVEQQLIVARDAANDALAAVDKRSALRHSASEERADASTTMLTMKIDSLQKVVDLRSEMNQTAIGKAEQATERRFDSVNEFRQTLSDQATTFVTRGVFESRIAQSAQIDQQTTDRIRMNTEQNLAARSEVLARVASLEGKFYVGGAGIVIIITVLQLVLNLWNH